MQATFDTLDNYSHVDRARVALIGLAFKRWMGHTFGCQHKGMSRPFSRHRETFRVCITCGAHRKFDEKTWNTVGPYYFKEARRSDILRH